MENVKIIYICKQQLSNFSNQEKTLHHIEELETKTTMNIGKL